MSVGLPVSNSRAARFTVRSFSAAVLGDRQVETGLGLLLVGHRGGADLEVALRRCQLFADRRLLRSDRRQIVLRGEHVEVGLGHPDHQVLRVCSTWASEAAASSLLCSQASSFWKRISGTGHRDAERPGREFPGA
jgi:hypothetical protein